jgi:LuxR family maltose regulon positive regulatory protein
VEFISRHGPLKRLDQGARVTVVSAPAGSGKTMLLRSWMTREDVASSAAWVPVGPEHRSPQQFWMLVLDALRSTLPGSRVVRELTAAPDLDGWLIVERLLQDLSALHERLWLVADDLHELHPSEALRQFELFLMRAPAQLRFVLSTRHDLRLGLHRLRLEGELAEVRSDDLRFSLAEAAELFAAAGVELPEPALAVLHQRTEGWAAGLRLAALALASHPDPARFAAEFSGTERTVAEYLLAEVLDRHSEPVRRLLLRTSILERVHGELADLLTGNRDGERVLQDLEQAGAFVTSLDPARSWFRYHQMFADLLQLELRRAAPGEMAELHSVAAGWLAGHGFGVEAVRHAQAAGDWPLAARLLASHWPGLQLAAQAVTAHELLAGFPAEARAADALLVALGAADELALGSLEAAERYLALAARQSALVPDDLRGLLQVLLGSTRILIARWRGDLAAVTDEARRLQALAEGPQAAELGLGEDLLSAVAAQGLGITEAWAGRSQEARRDLERSVALARQARQPNHEYGSLVHLAVAEMDQSFAQAAHRSRQAIDLAARHGWTDWSGDGVSFAVLADILAWQARPEEAHPWVLRAERARTAYAEPAARLAILCVRGRIELALGRDRDALGAFQAAERFAGYLNASHPLVTRVRAALMYVMVRLGDTEGAEEALARLDGHDRNHAEARIAAATLRLAQGNPHVATDVLAPALDGSDPILPRTWRVQAFLLEAIARDALGDTASATRALEHALDLAEPDGVLLPFLLHHTPLLEHRAPHHTTHAALITEILSRQAGKQPTPAPGEPQRLREPLSESELRVLRYLPTNLTMQEIANQLHVSVNTVKAHARHLYAKLGSHNRGEAVEQARALRLLAPSARLRSPGAG